MNEIVRVAKELVLVLLVGAILALGANALSPKGLSLGRDYFGPVTPSGGSKADPTTHPTSDPSPTSNETPPDGGARKASVAEELAAEGLRSIDFEAVKALFEDELYQDEAYAFVDARNDDHYASGHVPGAWQLDHYYMDRYVDAVMSGIQGALKVVVYCGGGQCEDSKIAARHLVGLGIDASTVFVYLGGITEWTSEGMPLETGERNSGEIVKGGTR